MNPGMTGEKGIADTRILEVVWVLVRAVPPFPLTYHLKVPLLVQEKVGPCSTFAWNLTLHSLGVPLSFTTLFHCVGLLPFVRLPRFL